MSLYLAKKTTSQSFFASIAISVIAAASPNTSLAAEKKLKDEDRGTNSLAMRAKPKYSSNFSHFDFANPDANKGGTLTLASQAAFDTMNPFSAKGTTTTMISLANVFETLMTSSLDEPFSQYALLAKSVELGSDAMSVTFHINPEAQFSDGKAVTADDVIFSYELLSSEKSKPFYRAYYADVKSAEKTGTLGIKFHFKKKNSELHMILGQLPVLPKHFYATGDFNKDFVHKVLGSGPYIIKDFEFNKIVRAEKNKNYWGKNLPVNKGRFNFNSLVLKNYKNADVMLMGLKSGDFDFQVINSSKHWAVDVSGERYDKHCIVKELLPHKQTQGIQGFALNTRRPLFSDRRVRKALALALDFEWMNSSLFYKQYTPHASYFDNSDLAAHALPSADELKLLNPFKGRIPDEVFSQAPEALGKNWELRRRLTESKKLLEESGWKIQDGVLTNSEGKKFEFTILLDDPTWQRIVEPYIKNLRTLGISAQSRIDDQSLYMQKVKRFDYDAIVEHFEQSESPGNEQRDFWHSASANIEDSRNTIGIKDTSVDSLVESVIRAKSRKDLVTATHALDRVLWFNYYLVPHWYMSANRITYWNRFSTPKTLPLYYSPLSYFTEFASVDAAKEKLLKEKGCN